MEQNLRHLESIRLIVLLFSSHISVWVIKHIAWWPGSELGSYSASWTVEVVHFIGLD